MLSKKGIDYLLKTAVVVLAAIFSFVPHSLHARAAGPWYVALPPLGNDSSSCLTTTDPCATINGAIAKASAGDMIYVAVGTYVGDSNSNVVTINKSLTFSGGWDVNFNTQTGRSIIDGQSVHRGIYTTGALVTIDHFQIQHGNASSQGGGISNSNGTLTLNDSRVIQNHSGMNGGGIFHNGLSNSNATLTLNNSTVDGNNASSGEGGGISSNGGKFILNNSTVSNNIGDEGSGIYSTSAGTLNNSTISGNTGSNNGGIYGFVGNLHINNSTITNNQGTGLRGHGTYFYLLNSIVAGNGMGSDCYNDNPSVYGGMFLSQGYNLVGNSSDCTIAPTDGDQIGTSASPINPRLGSLIDIGGPTFTHALSTYSPAVNAGNPAIPGSGGTACLATDQRGVSRPQGGACDIGAYEGSAFLVSSIIRADPAPTVAEVVHFTVAFDEVVTGLDLTDFVITTSGVTGAAIDGMSGSGATYTIAVLTGTGAGTIRLDVVDDDSILDGSSQPLGGPGVGNGNYTSGHSYNIAGRWYVAPPPGGDDTNSCLSPASPCSTINGTLAKAAAGDTIFVSLGTYTNATSGAVVTINKSLSLSGGWELDFDDQTGLSVIDGQNSHQGVYSTGNPVVIDHFQITHGYASQGGGIRNYNGNLTINNSLINANYSSLRGGGINNYGTLTVNNSTIDGNTAGEVDHNGGGGGGALQNSSGTATLNNTTISNNTLLGSFDGTAIDAGGTVNLNNCTVSGNSGSHGEAIYTFVDNVNIRNSTITNNATYGFKNVGGHITMQNTIIAGNGGSSDCYNDPGYSGTVVSLGYNLIGKSNNCSIVPGTGDQMGTSLNPIDAKLGSLQNNGGPTFTHALTPSSPAIDGGNPAIPGSDGSACLVNDQRGVSRPYGYSCDIGAFEAQFTVVHSIARTDASPTRAATIHFNVTFSEAVSGVDTTAPFADFSLTTSGLTGVFISNVSGSGNTYIVTVESGSGSGTIRLNVVDNDTILGETDQPLGGVGLGNGNYNSGQVYTIDWNSPTVLSSQRADSNPAHAGDVHFSVKFSEEVVGVDTDDFALSITGSLTGMSINEVNGSGSTYFVSANTGTGIGTLRLDVPFSANISDISGNLIAGLPFTGGQAYNLNYFIYLPLVTKPPVKSLYGQVTQAGNPVEGVVLELRFYNGDEYVSLDYTATDTLGHYAFEDLPTLSIGQSYYVRYLNDGFAPGRLWMWSTRLVDQYVDTDSVHLGDFDIADIILPPPPEGGHLSVILPYTFHWMPRPATPTNSYEFDLYDPYSSLLFYTYPDLGYTGSYTLQALPSGFSFNTFYIWEVWVYGPDGGYGISNEYREVMFLNSGIGYLVPVPQSGPLPKPAHKGQDALRR